MANKIDLESRIVGPYVPINFTKEIGNENVLELDYSEQVSFKRDKINLIIQKKENNNTDPSFFIPGLALTIAIPSYIGKRFKKSGLLKEFSKVSTIISKDIERTKELLRSNKKNYDYLDIETFWTRIDTPKDLNEFIKKYTNSRTLLSKEYKKELTSTLEDIYYDLEENVYGMQLVKKSVKSSFYGLLAGFIFSTVGQFMDKSTIRDSFKYDNSQVKMVYQYEGNLSKKINEGLKYTLLSPVLPAVELLDDDYYKIDTINISKNSKSFKTYYNKHKLETMVSETTNINGSILTYNPKIVDSNINEDYDKLYFKNYIKPFLKENK
jgi:hypothetical protein